MIPTNEQKKLLLIITLFSACFFMPIGSFRFDNAVIEGLKLVRWYTRTYVLLTLVPAFFMAGAIGAFVSRESVLRYLGAGARMVLAYGVAAISGAVIAVCSCAVLPLFSGIHKKGAGLGPAVTFLYSGPAVNILAIVLTARVLGTDIGVARAVAAIVFSVVIGLLMHILFRKEKPEKNTDESEDQAPVVRRSMLQTAVFFAAMIGIMVFSNWARSGNIRAVLLCCPGGLTTYEVEGHMVEQTETRIVIIDSEGQEISVTPEEVQKLDPRKPNSLSLIMHRSRWLVVGALTLALAIMLQRWFAGDELRNWVDRTWGFAKRMLPPLVLGVLAAGFFLGGQEGEGIIPRRFVEMLAGSSPEPFLAASGIEDGTIETVVRTLWTFWTNLFASTVGVFMYFATLTEVPIVRALMRSGMDKGPALALLLAGPAVSLPNMLVIRGVIGTRKTLAYVGLVVAMATISGIIYGAVA